jgi:hypothetical protein
MLKGYTVPLSPRGIANLATKPPWHYDTQVSWCPYIYVDNDHAMARGWIQGFPKKLGTVAQTRSFAGPNQAAPVLGAGGKFGATAVTAGYRAMESCDALLVLGADFPYRDFYPSDVPVVQVDVRGALAFVELEMMSAGVPKWGTDLDNPDFAEVARSVGLYGVRVERPDELGPALRAAFEHDGPALVDVHTRRAELSVPPHVTFSELKGVSLFAGRTILSGRGDELVDLARDNLR